MFKHVVLFKLKEQSDKEKLFSMLARLSSIPEIVEWDLGLQEETEREGRFDISLISTFENEVAFEAYFLNEKHQVVLKYLQNLENSGKIEYAVVDYTA